MDNIIIIPAYNPDNILIQLVDEIIDKVSKRLIVINDGSEEKYNDIFDYFGIYYCCYCRSAIQ